MGYHDHVEYDQSIESHYDAEAVRTNLREQQSDFELKFSLGNTGSSANAVQTN